MTMCADRGNINVRRKEKSYPNIFSTTFITKFVFILLKHFEYGRLKAAYGSDNNCESGIHAESYFFAIFLETQNKKKMYLSWYLNKRNMSDFLHPSQYHKHRPAAGIFRTNFVIHSIKVFSEYWYWFHSNIQ